MSSARCGFLPTVGAVPNQLDRGRHSYTSDSQARTRIVLHRLWFIHSFHRTYYCCFYIYLVFVQKKVPGDSASRAVRGTSLRCVVTPID
jgi:hypothetical protein